MNKINALILFSGTLALTGCQEYMLRSDSLNMHSGDAIQRNLTNQMVDPWPIYVQNTDIETNSKRQGDIRERYENLHEKEEVAPQQVVLMPTGPGG